MPGTGRRSVLVLCTGNSARSQMMEAIIRDRLGDRIEVASAGTEPAREVHPLALLALEEIGVSAGGAEPKRTADLDDRRFDIAVTVCDRARESCPVLPGAPVKIHVGYPDPAAVKGTKKERLAAFREVRDSMASWTDFLAAILVG
jgi:arsenate reductase